MDHLTSPPVAKQERLLQGLMREIVRMTAQKQPLEVGVPLYYFSHEGVFNKDTEGASSGADNPPPPAPLPHSSGYQDPSTSPSVSVNGRHSPSIVATSGGSGSRPVSSSEWGIKDLSTSPQTANTEYHSISGVSSYAV